MKKTINRKSLLDIALKMVKHVHPNAVIRILECFMIKDNEITVDNQEVRIAAQIPKEGDINPLSEVDVCIPARQFVTALQNMDSDEIALKFDKGKVTVSDPIRKKAVSINTFGTNEFLEPQKADGNSTYLPIPAAHFLPALEKAASFVDSNSSSKFDYVGLTVYDEVLHINGGTTRNFYSMQVDIPGIKSFDAIITVKGANALCQIEEVDEVTIERRGNFIFCSNSNISIQARCMEGIYPDTRVPLKSLDDTWTVVDRKSVIGASNLCAAIKNENPLILLESDESGIVFATLNESEERAKQLIECSIEAISETNWYTNPDFKKSLSAIDTDEVRMNNKQGIMFLSPVVEPLGTKETIILAKVGK